MITHQWTHPNAGADIDLTPSDLNGKVWLSSEGIEGMGMPEFDNFTRETPLLDGQSFQGWRAKPRDVFWPVVIDAMKGSEFSWNALQSAFWKTMRPGVPGVWRVTGPSGYRELTCRFRNDGGAKYGIDPTKRKVEKHGITMIADDPWWRGPTVSQTVAVSRLNLLKKPSGRRGGTSTYSAAAGTLGQDAGSSTYNTLTSTQAAGGAYIAIETLTIGVDIAPGATYTFSASVYGSAASAGVFAGGTGIASGGAPTTVAAGAFTRTSTTFVAGASGSITFYVLNRSSAASGSNIAFRDAMVAAGSTLGSYFDGATAPAGGFSYSWSGVADASYSIEMPNITIANAGDVPVWPKYRLNGPATSFRVSPFTGMTSQGVGGTITVAAGEHVLIDTDPNVQTAMLSSGGETTYTDVTNLLTSVYFFPTFPASGTSATQVTIIGGGSLVASITPGYYRAF